MAQITSAIAAKQLRKLTDRQNTLLAREKKSRSFTAAIQEDVESVRPPYDYEQTQKELEEIDAKIRQLKHTINCFNSTYVISEFDMNYSIEQAEADYQSVSDELARAQNALDSVNATVLFEAKID